MSQIAGLSDARGQGAPADIGNYQFAATAIVFKFTFSGVSYTVAMASGVGGWTLIAQSPSGADDVEIQAAIDYVYAVNGVYGGSVYIRSALYDIAAPIDLTGRYNLTLYGDTKGRPMAETGGGLVDEGTCLKLAAGVDDHLLQMIETAPTKFTGLVIRDLSFDGRRGGQTPGAASDVLHFEYIKEAIIERCVIKEPRRRAVHLSHASENVWLLKNDIRSAGGVEDAFYVLTSTGIKIVDNVIVGASAVGMASLCFDQTDYCLVMGNSFSDSDYGISIRDDSDFNTILGNQIGDNASLGIRVYDSTFNLITANTIRNITTNDGILLTGVGANTPTDNKITDNIITLCGRYGINVIGDSDRNIIKDNYLLGNTTAPFSDTSSGVNVYHTVKGDFPVSNVGGGAAAVAPVINTSPGGVDIDAADEFCYVHIPLPVEVQQIVRIKLWAYSNVIEATNNMLLRIVAHGAGSSELWSGNAIDVVDHPSEEEGAIVQYDILHWVIDATDDAQIGTLAAQDLVELMAVGEAASAPDIATDALFGGYEIEYV